MRMVVITDAATHPKAATSDTVIKQRGNTSPGQPPPKHAAPLLAPPPAIPDIRSATSPLLQALLLPHPAAADTATAVAAAEEATLTGIAGRARTRQREGVVRLASAGVREDHDR